MDRKLYLELCQRVSMLKPGIAGIIENVPDDLTVLYNGICYYPVAYQLSFNEGQTVHTAILHDLGTNSLIHADLRKVGKYV